ncbi:MAG: hypothetical protein LBR27_06695 [Bifidobacteriaceae bacterium]|nr:hypothetical protein [Bifidobacteriaceae bacterium]
MSRWRRRHPHLESGRLTRFVARLVAPAVLGLGVATAAPALAATAADGAPAGTVHDGACAPGEGVTLVLDAGAEAPAETWPDVVVRCVSGETETALAALAAAGFQYEFRPGFPGMVCTIGGWPNPCNGAPAEAYWSFWDGTDGAWAYAMVGGGSFKGSAGAVLGWAFGAGEPPRIDPPAPSTATPAAGAAGSARPTWAAPAVSTGAEPGGQVWPLALTGLLVAVAAAAGLVVVAWRRRHG